VPRAGTQGRTHIDVSVSVEPITPCATNTRGGTPLYRQLNFSGRKEEGNTSKQGTKTGGPISRSSIQVSTPRGGSSSSQFNMAGHDFTIKLPVREEASEDPENNSFICENIWEEKKITDEDTKLAQLAITLRDHTLDWYMNLYVNNPPGRTQTIAYVKKLLINEFQKPSLED
jgi:hypothetical protein